MELNKNKKTKSKKRSLSVVQVAETKVKVPEVPNELVIHITGLPGSNIIHCIKELFTISAIQLPNFDEILIQYLDSTESIKYRNLKSNAVSDVVLEGPDSWSILTTDIIYAIISFIYPRDVLNLLLANKKLFFELNDAPIWKHYSGQKNLSLTSLEHRKLIFSERWTYNHMHTYVDYRDNNYQKDKNIKFIVHPLDVFLRTYKNFNATPKNKEFVLFVADISKYNTDVTELDGSAINYRTKFNEIVSELKYASVNNQLCIVGINELRQRIEAGEKLPLADNDLLSDGVDCEVLVFISEWRFFTPFRRRQRIWNHNSPLTIEDLFDWSHGNSPQNGDNWKNGPRNRSCCMLD